MTPANVQYARRSNHVRRAFTLIEMLVVVAIIAILVSLLLPAVQNARESARRSQCRNNLMQLGIALQNYESAHLVLPPGTVNATGPIEHRENGYHFSWIVPILPFLEQRNVYEQFDRSVSVYDERNEKPRFTSIHVLQCPSGAAAGGGAASYAGCHHDVESPIDVDNHGVLYLNSSTRYDEIPDGASNTIYLGETRECPLGFASGTASTLRNMGIPINGTPDAPKPGSNGELLLEVWRQVGGFGSDHRGGAHFCLGDGAVRLIHENINVELYQRLGHRADGQIVSDF